MAATIVDRNTPALHVERQIKLPLKAATDIPAGAIVSVDATGNAVNGADAVGQIVMGRAAHAASYAAGDRWIVVERGVFWYANDGTVLTASIGSPCTILDNQTVSLAATTVNDIVAGYVEAVDSVLGVAVAMLGGKVGAN